jgi:hypothetical protein
VSFEIFAIEPLLQLVELNVDPGGPRFMRRSTHLYEAGR